MSSLDALFLLGRPIGPLYDIIMRVRAFLYRKKIFGVTYLPVPVISVGNLTMGGTGKTPATLMIAQMLLDKGFTPGIISRGYRGSAKAEVNVVSDGINVLLGPEEAGDEPCMMAMSAKNVRVLTGRKRAAPCLYAVETLGCDILILDDGFQHLAVHRDLDIVLFNATTLAGNGRVFPGGELREGFEALHRADIVVLTGVNDTNKPNAQSFMQEIENRFPYIPVHSTASKCLGIYDSHLNKVEYEKLPFPLYAFSGIAHPQRFLQMAKEQSINLSGFRPFSDHARYSESTLRQLSAEAKKSGARALLTTHKDLVKITQADMELPLYTLMIESMPDDGLATLLEKKISEFSL